MRVHWLALLLVAWGLQTTGQARQATVPGAATDRVFEIDFTHPGQTPPHWKLTLHPDGSGHFHSENKVLTSAAAMSATSTRSAELPDLDRDIHLSARFTQRVFDIARRRKLFNEPCESPVKVAFTGRKTLSYRGPEGAGSCTFNYGLTKDVESLGSSLESVAESILEGERLRLLLAHDRLGLDQEMENLALADADGRVEQIGVIRDVLQQLCDDPRVMERVKKRARALLAHVDEE
jgi:hypothetical protein